MLKKTYIVKNLCSCYFFTKLDCVLAMFCSLPLMHGIHYVRCHITKARMCQMIRGVLLYFMVFDCSCASIHSLLNLTQRGCLYLLYPHYADHAVEQCDQFAQQELVFHYLVQKIKQLQCLSAHRNYKARTKVTVNDYSFIGMLFPLGLY